VSRFFSWAGDDKKGTKMDEQTTTDTPVETGATIQGVQVNEQGQAVAEPETTETVTADVQTTEEPSQEAPQEEEPSADDNSTVEWLKNKGVDPNSPEALEKVAEMARNAEKQMHTKAQKASELEKAIDKGITEEAEDQGLSDDDRLDIVRIKTKLSVREFFENNPEAKQYEQTMIETLAEKPHLAGDLESLYANAVVKSGSLKSQGKKEALESLAHKQTAAVPTGNAVNQGATGVAITPENVDTLVGQNNHEWYLKNLDAINRAMAG